MEIKIYQVVFFSEGLPYIVFSLCLEIRKKSIILLGKGSSGKKVWHYRCNYHKI